MKAAHAYIVTKIGQVTPAKALRAILRETRKHTLASWPSTLAVLCHLKPGPNLDTRVQTYALVKRALSDTYSVSPLAWEFHLNRTMGHVRSMLKAAIRLAEAEQ